MTLVDMKNKVDDVCSDGCGVQLDAQNVEQVDGAALQFLMAFARSNKSSSPAVINSNDVLEVGFASVGVDADALLAITGPKT